MTRGTIRGTHLGAMLGVAPTGKQVTWIGMDMFRIAGGKIADHWSDRATLGLMQQVGVLPSLEQGR